MSYMRIYVDKFVIYNEEEATTEQILNNHSIIRRTTKWKWKAAETYIVWTLTYSEGT
jgi:hypothetical protein